MRFIELVPALAFGSKGHGKHGKKRGRRTTTSRSKNRTTSTRKKKFRYKY